jgi:cytochrome c-type biogenesis protein CcmH/NrfF
LLLSHRRALSFVLAAVLMVLGAFAPEAALAAEGGGHGSRGMIILDDLEIEQRQRARKLWAEIVCKCPNENWSKSLLNCPDGCADPQKQEILQQILLGWDDQRVIDYQVQAYGPRAHGKPDDLMTYLLPVLMLVGSAVVVAVVFARWKRSAAEAHAQHAGGTPADDAELAAVERELKELR